MKTVEATFIHVEDDPNWQNRIEVAVKNAFKLSSQQYFRVTSIKNMHKLLKDVVGPIIILMDLQHDESVANFEGYEWIRERAMPHLFNNPHTALFIISIYLDNEITQVFRDLHVAEDHVYAKQDLQERLPELIKTIQLDVQRIHATIARPNHIDPYLRHQISAATDLPSASTTDASGFDYASDETVDSETLATEGRKQWFPMLLEVKRIWWNPEDIPEFEVLSELGNIITARGTKTALDILQKHDAVNRIEASRPAEALETKSSVPYVNASKIHQINEKGDKAIVAIIDSGIDILHGAFLDRQGGKSRILGVWVQGAALINSPDLTSRNPAKKLTFGRYYDNDAINMYIDAYKTRRTLPPSELRDMSGHGTHVASIAAGRPFENFIGGIAPEAQIIVVVPNLDFESGSPQSLGYNASFLPALSFIKEFSEWMKLPVVINVSQGMNAGAHDGTSLLEAAFDSVTNMGREPGIAIVKSAGNQGDSDSHVNFTIPASQQEILKWETKDTHQVTIEIWTCSNIILSFRLKAPNGSTISMGFDIEHETNLTTGDHIRFNYDRINSDNGDSRITLTLLQKTSVNDWCVQNGVWELEILNLSSVNDHPLDETIHAWIERHTQTARFVGKFIDRTSSLTVPATAHSVIVVGAMQQLPEYPEQVALYSGYGPTRTGVKKPELIAPGHEISAARAGSEIDLISKSGTSMAAPHVTGAIALLFSRRQKKIAVTGNNIRQITANQIRKVLQFTAQGYDGNWDKGKGYGVLDVERFLSKFDNL